jgi:Domain of unknown function (DUF222)
VDERDDAGESASPAEPRGKPVPQPKVSRSEDAPYGSGDTANAASGVTGSGVEGLPRCVPEDDFDADAEMARWVADIEAGRERIPEEWELDGSVIISLSLGDACDLDPALLAAMLGPDGLGGQSLSPAFGQDQAADALRPGPVLAALTEQAIGDRATMSDDQLTGGLQASRRLKARAAYQETLWVAEFGRRRTAAFDDAKARRVPPGRRPGEFAADELAAELVCTANYADARLERDAALTARLPRTLAGMAAGVISSDRADTIAAWTMSLSDADAARADEILAAAAPALRLDQLSRKAAALEMKLNPEGVKARKEHAKAMRQRVEVRREDTGNASIAGRELDTVTVLGCKSYIDALAVRIRNHGHPDGGLDAIRARVMTELLQGRNPLNLLTPRPKPAADPDDAPPTGQTPDGNDAPGGNDGGAGHDGDRADGGAEGAEAGPFGGADVRDPDDPGPDYPGDLDDADDYDDCGDPAPGYAGPDGALAWTAEEAENARHDEPDDPARRRGPLRPEQSAPPPANLNLIIPIGALLGWSTAPAQAGGFGLLDPDETRALVAAASRHPRTRWSVTLTDPAGRAIAHGRARGQHPWEPPPQATTPPGTSPSGTSPPGTAPPGTSPPGTQPPPPPPPNPQDGPSPNADQAARLRHLIQALGIIFDPIAQDTCDHRQAENRYTPSRKLQDLIRARTRTCDAPGCGAQAVYCDLDHVTPWPDGPTDQCNLGPKCRRHHRAKQAPGWHVEQLEPGVTRWTLPNSRTHTTEPTTYDC